MMARRIINVFRVFFFLIGAGLVVLAVGYIGVGLWAPGILFFGAPGALMLGLVYATRADRQPTMEIYSPAPPMRRALGHRFGTGELEWLDRGARR